MVSTKHQELLSWISDITRWTRLLFKQTFTMNHVCMYVFNCLRRLFPLIPLLPPFEIRSRWQVNLLNVVNYTGRTLYLLCITMVMYNKDWHSRNQSISTQAADRWFSFKCWPWFFFFFASSYNSLNPIYSWETKPQTVFKYCKANVVWYFKIKRNISRWSSSSMS